MAPPLLAATIVFIELGLGAWLFYVFRAAIVTLLQKSETIRAVNVAAEPLIAISMGVLFSAFNLTDSSMWSAHAFACVIASSLWGGLLTCYLGIKVASWRAVDKNGKKIIELERDLAAEASLRYAIEWQRDEFIRLASTIRSIIDRKLRRIEALGDSEDLTYVEYIQAASPSDQILVILTLMHEFFRKNLKPDSTLRLGVYLRDSEESNRLFPIYSWNGERSDCFDSKSIEAMRLDDPAGTPSEVVKSFHSASELKIIPDCKESQKLGEFTYLYPGQDQHLKSMVLFKTLLDNKGAQDSMIIALDSSEADAFRHKNEEAVRRFFIEIVKRLEYELLHVEILNKLSKNHQS